MDKIPTIASLIKNKITDDIEVWAMAEELLSHPRIMAKKFETSPTRIKRYGFALHNYSVFLSSGLHKYELIAYQIANDLHDTLDKKPYIHESNHI